AAAAPQPAKPLAKPAAAVAPAAGGAPGTPVAEPAPPPPKKIVARAEKKVERAKGGPARLELAVAPWGEVLIDGKSRGLSPPLRVLEVPPGPHTIEIRNSTFPAHVARIEVRAGEAVKIQHRFR
ncbi:MAG TPA: PEGA domain-containing protein, partial [Burkholderiales bacterium]|nr:PEGA domain-containing protein [Burkholderiales bacterium]